ncbi:MAG: DUF547 domain-containing protein [bacterium]
MKLLTSRWLVLVAALVLGVTFWFRPKGIDGPRPAPVAMEGRDFDHAGLTAVLQQAVGDDGRIDYAGLRAHPEALDRYLGQLRALSPKSAPHRFRSNEARLAYYINAYNAFMLAIVRDHCPVEDVNTIYPFGGLFWRVSFLLGEEAHTLSELESELIGDVKAGDPAVRFAVVKGANGFPALPRTAYSEEDVRPRLEALSQQVARDPRFIKREGDAIVASQLFEWYLAEFGGDLVAWLKRVAPTTAEGATQVTYTPFDWRLNGRCEPKAGGNASN